MFRKLSFLFHLNYHDPRSDQKQTTPFYLSLWNFMMLSENLYVHKIFCCLIVLNNQHDTLAVDLSSKPNNSFSGHTTFLPVSLVYYSLKQKNLYKGKGSPWPPFRIPGEVHPAYNSVRKLLHCRTMHGLIFTLLHQVGAAGLKYFVIVICLKYQHAKMEYIENVLFCNQNSIS